jgi:hypothetical protein
MPQVEQFLAFGRTYEIVMENDLWYSVRCGGETVWPRTQWPFEDGTQTPLTKNKLIEIQTSKYCRLEKDRQA